MKCSSCGRENRAQAPVCVHCGAELGGRAAAASRSRGPRWLWVGAAAVLLLAVLLVLGGQDRALAAVDVGSLSGKWTGSIKSRSGDLAGEMVLYVYENCSLEEDFICGEWQISGSADSGKLGYVDTLNGGTFVFRGLPESSVEDSLLDGFLFLRVDGEGGLKLGLNQARNPRDCHEIAGVLSQ